MIYPVDKAGGTWAGLHDLGHVIILLNGAFKDHTKKNNYNKSRGLIVTQLMDSEDPVFQWVAIDLDNIEPFTLVMLCNGKLYETRWDGYKKYSEIKNISQPHIWSSATLYNEAAQKMRLRWFEKGKEKISSASELYNFLNAHQQAQNGFVMKRNGLIQTLSISLLQHKAGMAQYIFYDLLNKKQTQISVKLTSKKALCR